MCEVGIRCASHSLKKLEAAKSSLEANERAIVDAKAQDLPKEEIAELRKQNAVLVQDVNKAQVSYDATPSGLKKLTAEGYAIGDRRYDRAVLQGVFNGSVKDRKKRTGKPLPERNFNLREFAA